MKILIAPDAFKGSLTAAQFCDISSRAIAKILPSTIVHSCPLADGGEGTVDALVANTHGTMVTLGVHGPRGELVSASYGILGDGHTAVIEMASASGLPLLEASARNPMYSSTYGTGELIADALDRGCRHIILGIGGSATHDAGAGALAALGVLLLDDSGQAILPGAEGLLQLDHISTHQAHPLLKECHIEIACDVANPLLGDNGATAIYAPQKGATQEQMIKLEQALERFSRVASNDCDFDISLFSEPGTGAAGGLGAGLAACLDARLKPGFGIIAETLKLEQQLDREQYDLIITGEGEINLQTLQGKLPVGIARLAAQRNIPVVAIVGNIGEGAELTHAEGITSIFSIIDGVKSLPQAMDDAPQLLERCVTQIVRLWQAAESRASALDKR